MNGTTTIPEKSRSKPIAITAKPASSNDLLCATCLYRDRSEHCHRYPPVRGPEGYAGIETSRWPKCPPGGWCGEWRGK